jgi:hypothetical protein
MGVVILAGTDCLVDERIERFSGSSPRHRLRDGSGLGGSVVLCGVHLEACLVALRKPIKTGCSALPSPHPDFPFLGHI